mgnify:CR=1 FL=1
MDSPSQQQRRIAHVDPSTSDTQAFRHGSSSEVREGLETPPDLKLETERLTASAVSMERRGVVAPPGGQAPVSVMSQHSNVRSDGSIPDVSQQHEEFKQLPDDAYDGYRGGVVSLDRSLSKLLLPAQSTGEATI